MIENEPKGREQSPAAFIFLLMDISLFFSFYFFLSFKRNVHGRLNASWKICSLAVNGQSFLVIFGYLLNSFSWLTINWLPRRMDDRRLHNFSMVPKKRAAVECHIHPYQRPLEESTSPDHVFLDLVPEMSFSLPNHKDAGDLTFSLIISSARQVL